MSEPVALLEAKYDRLVGELRPFGGALVAFSGGVDSSFLLRACCDALPGRVRAAIGVSPALQRENLEVARRIAGAFGLSLEEVATEEMQREGYVANGPDRCFHCKNELFSVLGTMRELAGDGVVLDGTNADDLSDVRPGRRAAKLHGVRSPLADHGWTKGEIRSMSHVLGLETWDRPASPCLSSRIPHGISVTNTALRRIEAGEEALRALGFRELRVRHHGDLARVEVAEEEMPVLLSRRPEIVSALRDVGYRRIVLDLDGYRPGGAGRVRAGDGDPVA